MFGDRRSRLKLSGVEPGLPALRAGVVVPVSRWAK